MIKNIFIGGLIFINLWIIYFFQIKNQEITDLERIIWELNTRITLLTPGKDMILDDENNPNCLTHSTYYWVTGNSMEPLIQNGIDVNVIENYYTCSGKVSRWDIIVFELNKKPMIKIIKALPWDIIKFESQQMFINGEVMKNSVDEIYYFSQSEVNLLRAYLQNDTLQSGAFFVFWDNISNSLDSRKIWAVGIESFLAKVDRK